MKYLIIIIYLITTNFGYTTEKPKIKNLVVNNDLKTYNNITFIDSNEKIAVIGRSGSGKST